MSEKLHAPLWAADLGLPLVGQKRQDYISGLSHSGAGPPRNEALVGREGSVVNSDTLTLIVPHG